MFGSAARSVACSASVLFALSSLSLKPPFSNSSVQRFSVRQPPKRMMLLRQ
jgi:hypothetical protein